MWSALEEGGGVKEAPVEWRALYKYRRGYRRAIRVCVGVPECVKTAIVKRGRASSVSGRGHTRGMWCGGFQKYILLYRETKAVSRHKGNLTFLGHLWQ